LQISNSEAETYDKCERAHYYQFGLGLMPKQVPRPVRIGVLGHRILEAYYRTGLETTQRQEWYRAGLDELTKLFQHVDNDDDWDILSLLGVRFGQYAEHYATDRWRVIDVEGHYEKKLSDDITYAMRLDLLVEVIAGPYSGQHLVVDHKFCYAFQSPDELSMNSQLTKYIATLRDYGFNVSRGILNQVRYREDVKDPLKIFRREVIRPTDERIAGMLREQLMTSQLIKDRLTLPISAQRVIAKRSISKYNCGLCGFLTPCGMSLDGRDYDESIILASDYEQNTYGYRQ
jgi:hypothetical protein